MSVNKIFLIGNVGKDPEVKEITSGQMARFSLATSEKYKNNKGELVETTEWHRIVCFGKTAEVVAEYVKKGTTLFVEGKIKYTKYTGADGIEKYSTDIQATMIQMLSSRQKEQGHEISKTGAVKAVDYDAKYPVGHDPDPFDDEIPF